MRLWIREVDVLCYLFITTPFGKLWNGHIQVCLPYSIAYRISEFSIICLFSSLFFMNMDLLYIQNINGTRGFSLILISAFGGVPMFNGNTTLPLFFSYHLILSYIILSILTYLTLSYPLLSFRILSGRQYIEWLGERLQIKQLDDWYTVKSSDIWNLPHAVVPPFLHTGAFYRFLEKIYPGNTNNNEGM